MVLIAMAQGEKSAKYSMSTQQYACGIALSVQENPGLLCQFHTFDAGSLSNSAVQRQSHPQCRLALLTSVR